MNITKYPAMADFVNEKLKVAIFVMDEPRLLMGTSQCCTQNTAISKFYYKELGYKILELNDSVYNIRRNEVKKTILSLIS